MERGGGGGVEGIGRDGGEDGEVDLGLWAATHCSTAVRAIRCKSGTEPAHGCHAEPVELRHRAFRFYPAALKPKNNFQQ